MLLNELNAALQANAQHLGLPSFRTEVSPSGNNLQWLKKNLTRKEDCPVRIKELVRMSITELTRP